MKKFDLTGQRFGRWTVLREDAENPNKKRIFWLCRCDCGNEGSVATGMLRHGKSRSCGCFQRERAANRDGIIRLTFAHKTATLKEWAEITGISYRTLFQRYKNGWPVEQILLMPVAPIGNKSKRETAREEG